MSQSMEKRTKEYGEKYHKASENKSLSRALAILSTFDETTPMQRTSDIAMKLHMNISTVSRHLNTMLDWGFLERDDTTGLYFPGFKLIMLAGAALQNNEVYHHAYPELQRLSYKYSVHCHMGVPRKTEVIHLISSCGENAAEMHMPIGHRHPMYCSAMGRAILAYMPKEDVENILERSELVAYASGTKTDPKDIMLELIHVKKQGYCLLMNELAEGKASIAVPIFDRRRIPVAAISASTSVSSLSDPQRRKSLAKALLTTSVNISGRLG